MTTTISATKLKNNISQVLNEVAYKGNVAIVERHGKATAVIMSAEEYESRKETDEILADKKLMKDLKEAEEDIKNGRYVTFEELKRELNLDVWTSLKKEYQLEILEALIEIKENPLLGKPLERELKRRFSYRFSGYRIIYMVNLKDKVVDILSADHRGKVYNWSTTWQTFESMTKIS